MRALRRDLSEYAASRRRYVLAYLLIRPKNVVLENRSPRGSGLCWHAAQSQHAMQKTVETRARSDRLAGDRMPPVVHQHVALRERLHVMPLQCRNVDRIAGLELGHLGMLERLAESRETLEVRRGE